MIYKCIGFTSFYDRLQKLIFEFTFVVIWLVTSLEVKILNAIENVKNFSAIP